MPYKSSIKRFASTLLVVLATRLPAESIVVGATYPIDETDALEEIEQRARRVDWQDYFSRSAAPWGALTPVTLPSVQQDNQRSYIPYYTTRYPVTDSSGRVLYPAGYRFNPLAYAVLPTRIVVIGPQPEHLEWLRAQYESGDVILAAGGDPLALAEALQTPVYRFPAIAKERLGVRAVPCIVSQKGSQLHIEEHHVPAT